MVKHNVYIHECWNCMQLVALNERECSFCRTRNDYYEASLSVPADVQRQVQSFLVKYCKPVLMPEVKEE